MSSEIETTLRIEGMTCGACERHVREALASVEGVCGVNVDRAEGIARVEHTGGVANATLVAAVESAGYGASPIAT